MTAYGLKMKYGKSTYFLPLSDHFMGVLKRPTQKQFPSIQRHHRPF
jgi:hypothetical protein